MNIKDYEILKLETLDEIRSVIHSFDTVFSPNLSEMLPDLDEYAEKLWHNAITYVAKSEDYLGFVSFYANDFTKQIAYISQIGVHPTYQGRKIGKSLMNKCIEYSKSKGMEKLKLEVYKQNNSAIGFYNKNAFVFNGESTENTMYLIKIL